MSGVKLTSVEKAFGEIEVIKGVNLDIKAGEFTVFVGPSGCGKSTLLRLVAGLEETTRGKIEIGDKDVTHYEPSERGVAMVFQSYALYPHMNVRENMGFGLKMTGHPKDDIEKRVQKAAEILHLEALLDRKPKAMSGGQRQRVAIGRAIVREPEVFLFDEPLSNLDAELRVQMRLEIAKLHKDLGATMIYVTHDQVEAMTLADRIVVLRAGIVEQFGTPLELYEDPDNAFVAGFIGSPKMNFLSATVTSVQGKKLNLTLNDFKCSKMSISIKGAPPAKGKKLNVGIRPEHFDPKGAVKIKTKIDVIEDLGGTAYGYANSSSDAPTTIELKNSGAKEGAIHSTGFSPAKAFLFDPDTNLRIR